MKLFALNTSNPFGECVARTLGTALARHEERFFEDGEHKFRPLESVRGEDVFVIHSLYEDPAHSVSDKFIQLLFFLGAVRDAGATRVTAVMPYLPFSRKDRRTKPRDPLTTRYVAQLLEAMEIDAVVTIDVHNISAFENAFRRPTVHLHTQKLFGARFLGRLGDGPVAVASPDPGGVKRAQLFRESLEASLGRSVGFALMEKRRSAGVVSGDLMAGDVKDATVLIIDDLISSGGTMVRAGRAFRRAGATKVYAVAAHGLFTGGAEDAVQDESIEKFIVTDTVPSFRLADDICKKRIEIVSAAPLVADAIQRLHTNGSISELLDGAH